MKALLKLRVPRILVIQLLFLHRYLHVLFHEALRIVRAYGLRSPGVARIGIQAWGSLAGQLLLRTLDRGIRVYQAMDCRGFDGELRLLRNSSPRWTDFAYVLAWSGFFLTIRWVNVPEFFGKVLMGVG